MRGIAMVLLSGAALALAVPGDARRADPDPTAGRVAGKPQACVSSYGNASLVIAGANTVMLNASGRRRWIATAIGCPALHSDDVLIVEHLAGGSEYCRDDRIRTLPRGLSIPGPFCRLSDFTPYDKPR